MRRGFWIVLIVPIVLLVGEAIYWRIAAERLRSGYQAWAAEQVADGWQIESGPPSIGGWPRSAVVTVPNLTLRHAGPMVPGDVRLALAGLDLSVALFDPTTLGLSLDGPMHVRAGELPDVIVTGETAVATVPLQPTGPQSVALHARGLRLEPATGAWHLTVGLLNAQAEIADSAAAGQPKPGTSFSIGSEAIALPAVVRWPLGTNVSSLSAEGTLTDLPQSDGQDSRQWAEAWRNAGGSLNIAHLAMGWGPLGLTSSARLALDDQLQPMGSGNGRIIGYAETLDRLAASGALTRPAATAAKAVLSLMAATSDADDPSSVDVPLKLQYRTLSIGLVPLLRLPEVDWPAR
ncbi:DUF2125 domain-containing protein [Rhodopila sp.]|uniref:DUF2125 domain-containing protein n=1 Tax=Rhodopila sp. TaxID=2480087 RepID=UPI003D0E1025